MNIYVDIRATVLVSSLVALLRLVAPRQSDDESRADKNYVVASSDCGRILVRRVDCGFSSYHVYEKDKAKSASPV